MNNQENIQLTFIVVGCILKRDDKYLLVQEKQKSCYGLWNLPAGKVDQGESLENAAVRETKEETGYDVRIVKKVYLEHLKSDEPVKHAFEAEIVGGEIEFDPDELLDVRWFTLDEIKELEKEEKLRNSRYVLESIRAVRFNS